MIFFQSWGLAITSFAMAILRPSLDGSVPVSLSMPTCPKAVSTANMFVSFSLLIVTLPSLSMSMMPSQSWELAITSFAMAILRPSLDGSVPVSLSISALPSASSTANMFVSFTLFMVTLPSSAISMIFFQSWELAITFFAMAILRPSLDGSGPVSLSISALPSASSTANMCRNCASLMLIWPFSSMAMIPSQADPFFIKSIAKAVAIPDNLSESAAWPPPAIFNFAITPFNCAAMFRPS